MFYISSRGSAANMWLAKVLSKHPNIVCFRATRSFPPYESGAAAGQQSVCTPDEFIKGLLECEKATHNEKMFGAIHGYPGIAAKEACESNGGFFGYTTRHPISRIHSAFIYYMDAYLQRQRIKIANKDIHDYVCSELLFNRDLSEYQTIPEPHIIGTTQAKSMFATLLPRPIKKFIKPVINAHFTSRWPAEKTPPPDESKRVAYTAWLFNSTANSFLKFDRQLYDNCSLAQGIKMEDMTQSVEYFKSRVGMQIAPNLEWPDKYIDDVLLGKKFNVHRSKPILPQEIWRTWPEGMRNMMIRHFDFYNTVEMCNEFDYDISYL